MDGEMFRQFAGGGRQQIHRFDLVDDLLFFLWLELGETSSRK
jgi:hypothetical protein